MVLFVGLYTSILEYCLYFPKYCQNPNSTLIQPNITLVGFDIKMTLHTTHHIKLYIRNISAVTEPI